MSLLCGLHTALGKRNLVDLFAWMQRMGAETPVVMYMAVDVTKTTHNLLHADLGGPSIGRHGFYLQRTPEAAKRREAYLRYLGDFFRILEETGAGAGAGRLPWITPPDPEAILRCETWLTRFLEKDDAHNEKNHHMRTKMTTATFRRVTGLDLDAWAEAGSGSGTSTLRHVAHVSTSGASSLGEVVKHLHAHDNAWNNDWYSFWAYQTVSLVIHFVPALWQRKYEFLRPFTMMEPPATRAEHALGQVMTMMNSTFSEAYLSLARRPRIVKQARDMFEELRGVFREWLEQNKLEMTPSTQTKAMQKLRAMRLVPGSKPRWTPDPTSSELPFGDNALDNIRRYAAWLYAVEWNKGDRPIEDDDVWNPSRDDHVYVVNAFYKSNANTIVLPTGILQPPYVLEEGGGSGAGAGAGATTLRKRIYNVAYLGTLIGHEMFHAFDLDGFQMDAHGQYRKDWYKAEKEWYRLRRPALLATYKAIAKRQNYKVDQWNDDTLSENLADLYGLFLTEDLLERKLDEWKVTGEAARKAAFRQFFEDYAKQWRSTLRVRNMNRLLYHNEHILPQMRVNVTLSLSKRFREVYGIQPGEGMYTKDEV